MPASVSTPADADVLLAAIRGQVARIRTAIPALVESYDRATRTAVVRPVADVPYRDADGEVAWTPSPAIAHVPVAFPLLTWDLAVGDDVLLVFCERSVAEWKATGGRGHRPQDVGRRHDPTDAIAIPGLMPPSGPFSPTSVAAGAAVLEHADLRLGSGAAAQYVALASLVATQLGVLSAAISAAPVLAGDGGATFKAALIAALVGWPATMAATRVKAL